MSHALELNVIDICVSMTAHDALLELGAAMSRPGVSLVLSTFHNIEEFKFSLLINLTSLEKCVVKMSMLTSEIF